MKPQMNAIERRWVLRGIRANAREIRVRDRAGAFRMIDLAILAEAAYVLRAIQKKSQRTARRDIDLAADRLRELKRRP